MSGKRIRLGSIPADMMDADFFLPDGFYISQLKNNGSEVVFIKPYHGEIDLKAIPTLHAPKRGDLASSLAGEEL